jgi:AraC family transcriptional regulator
MMRDKYTVCESARARWTFCYYAPGETMQGHRHDCAQFSTLLIGGQRETSNKHSETMDSGLMAFKPVNFFHENEYSDGSSLSLSIDLFDIGEDDLEIDLNDWRVRDANSVRSDWLGLARAMCAPTPDENLLNDLTDDLLSAVSEQTETPARGLPPSWLIRARQSLVETTTSIDGIAKDAGVHRVHLSRMFRRYFGVSLSGERRLARLERAATAIIYARTPLAEASGKAGFADQSHLTREMRRETGITPGELMRLFNS